MPHFVRVLTYNVSTARVLNFKNISSIRKTIDSLFHYNNCKLCNIYLVMGKDLQLVLHLVTDFYQDFFWISSLHFACWNGKVTQLPFLITWLKISCFKVFQRHVKVTLFGDCTVIKATLYKLIRMEPLLTNSVWTRVKWWSQDPQYQKLPTL